MQPVFLQISGISKDVTCRPIGHSAASEATYESADSLTNSREYAQELVTSI